MPILPLPQFEADLAEAEREAYERLKPPTSIVVRFGVMKMVGEFPYSGDAKPGCGSKLIIRTHRGVELGEMLTSTCPNAGCSKSVTRQQMLQYIENSGGADYPFSTDGRVLRIATVEDMNEQSRIEAQAPAMLREARARATDLGLPMKVVAAEPILGGERLTFYFTAEDRVDFRDLVQGLAREFGARIEMRQVGARDEARITADYERCGQHCCCKQFLKVLKPVSMRSAKVQKATLDPLKISGRCGRLMCCLRYEDETYETLRKKLPRMKSRVGTPEGAGIVVDAQILTQLVLVQLERENRRVAVPVEELSEPGEYVAPPPPPEPRGRDAQRRPGDRRGPSGGQPGTAAGAGASGAPGSGGAGAQAKSGGGDARREAPRQGQPRREPDPLRGMDPARLERHMRTDQPAGRGPTQRQEQFRQRDDQPGQGSEAPRANDGGAGAAPAEPRLGPDGQPLRKKKKRRRRKRGGPGGPGASGGASGGPGGSDGPGSNSGGPPPPSMAPS